MAIHESNVPSFTHRIADHDARTELREQLTVLDVSCDFELSTETRRGQTYLLVAGRGNAGIVDDLAEDDALPLSYSQTYIDGETGATVTELEVLA